MRTASFFCGRALRFPYGANKGNRLDLAAINGSKKPVDPLNP
jgi:hypothetical protein